LKSWRRGTSAIGRRCFGAYPRVSPTVTKQARYRDPDAISGTWEAFERILKRGGYVTTGLRKVEAARAVAVHVDLARSRSRSFALFRDATAEAVGQAQ